ncbi:biotin carboxylase N-terminal domain-containing protein [Bdellovibrionota bacterium FG-2]
MKKVLIANRAEIACRIFQACRELGFFTVGVVAPGDEDARHVTFADEVYEIPSYLDAEAIILVALKSGARLVHPGYGFLSEQASFAQAVERAGLIFVGPRSETIELMGGKASAKAVAEQLGISTLPWLELGIELESGAALEQAALKGGFPLFVKAISSGGGKGMRKVSRLEELGPAVLSSKREARSSFGEGALYLERMLEKPRHIEVQVFGDGEGAALALSTRECSLQRRNQKILEEAPASLISTATREGLTEAALKIAKSVKYRNAGTVEFLVDGRGEFYFLEMNTRLQVEHPVTEMVTGIDLVAAQVALAEDSASFEFLARTDFSPRGHSLEARIYAEDPARGFVPTNGVIETLRWPLGAGIRVESGVEQGQNVDSRFDSLLGKLVVHAETREKARARLSYALSETVILGPATNLTYLQQLVGLEEWVSGCVDTQFLESRFEYVQALPEAEELEVLSLAQDVDSKATSKWKSPWFAMGRLSGSTQ